MPINPRIIKLHAKTRTKLCVLKKEAEQDGEYRVAKRIHAVLLNAQEKPSSEIAKILHTAKSAVSEWLRNYERYGYESFLEGHRSGRPSYLTEQQCIELGDIIDSGPIAYGFTSAIWSSIMLREVIDDEFSIQYHPGHVRKILKKMGFSIQKPKRILIRADEDKKKHWRRYIYPSIKKKPLR